MERKNAWTGYNETQLAELEALAKDYRKYLDHGKTERECVTESVALAKKAGYRDLEEVIAAGESLKAGDKVYAINMKNIICTRSHSVKRRKTHGPWCFVYIKETEYNIIRLYDFVC